MAKGHKDKVAVITGAAGGIGQAFAKRLAEDGVHIAIVDLGDSSATVKLVEAAGRQAIAVKCDVASEASVAAMAKEVGKKFSNVDIVVNCAGIFPQKNFPEMTFADWRTVLSINLDGTFLVTAAFVPACVRANGGRVVNNGLKHARFGGDGCSRTTLQARAALSLHACARQRSGGGRDYRKRDRARPDPLAGNFGACTAPRFSRPWMTNLLRVAQMQAIKRVEVPDDLVGAVSFLTSDDAAFITGQTLNVDGGACAASARPNGGRVAPINPRP